MKDIFSCTLFLGVILLLLSSCATTEPVSERDEEVLTGDPDETSVFEFSDDLLALYAGEFEAPDLRDLSPAERNLYETRSRLRNLFETQSHDMPAFYLQEVSEQEMDVNQGLRVQILSTRDIALADTTLARFEQWAQEAFADYVPRAYIRFRQPFYRVRVGDFHDRERAIELSRMLKSRYPDAWVIHDQVNAYRVPADSVEIRFVDVSDL